MIVEKRVKGVSIGSYIAHSTVSTNPSIRDRVRRGFMGSGDDVGVFGKHFIYAPLIILVVPAVNVGIGDV